MSDFRSSICTVTNLIAYVAEQDLHELGTDLNQAPSYLRRRRKTLLLTVIELMANSDLLFLLSRRLGPRAITHDALSRRRGNSRRTPGREGLDPRARRAAKRGQAPNVHQATVRYEKRAF